MVTVSSNRSEQFDELLCTPVGDETLEHRRLRKRRLQRYRKFSRGMFILLVLLSILGVAGFLFQEIRPTQIDVFDCGSLDLVTIVDSSRSMSTDENRRKLFREFGEYFIAEIMRNKTEYRIAWGTTQKTKMSKHRHFLGNTFDVGLNNLFAADVHSPVVKTVTGTSFDDALFFWEKCLHELIDCTCRDDSAHCSCLTTSVKPACFRSSISKLRSAADYCVEQMVLRRLWLTRRQDKEQYEYLWRQTLPKARSTRVCLLLSNGFDLPINIDFARGHLREETWKSLSIDDGDFSFLLAFAGDYATLHYKRSDFSNFIDLAVRFRPNSNATQTNLRGIKRGVPHGEKGIVWEPIGAADALLPREYKGQSNLSVLFQDMMLTQNNYFFRAVTWDFLFLHFVCCPIAALLLFLNLPRMLRRCSSIKRKLYTRMGKTMKVTRVHRRMKTGEPQSFKSSHTHSGLFFDEETSSEDEPDKNLLTIFDPANSQRQKLKPMSGREDIEMMTMSKNEFENLCYDESIFNGCNSASIHGSLLPNAGIKHVVFNEKEEVIFLDVEILELDRINADDAIKVLEAEVLMDKLLMGIYDENDLDDNQQAGKDTNFRMATDDMDAITCASGSSALPPLLRSLVSFEDPDNPRILNQWSPEGKLLPSQFEYEFNEVHVIKGEDLKQLKYDLAGKKKLSSRRTMLRLFLTCISAGFFFGYVSWSWQAHSTIVNFNATDVSVAECCVQLSPTSGDTCATHTTQLFNTTYSAGTDDCYGRICCAAGANAANRWCPWVNRPRRPPGFSARTAALTSARNPARIPQTSLRLPLPARRRRHFRDDVIAQHNYHTVAAQYRRLAQPPSISVRGEVATSTVALAFVQLAIWFLIVDNSKASGKGMPAVVRRACGKEMLKLHTESTGYGTEDALTTWTMSFACDVEGFDIGLALEHAWRDSIATRRRNGIGDEGRNSERGEAASPREQSVTMLLKALDLAEAWPRWTPRMTATMRSFRDAFTLTA